jgi:hypothetical protein
LGYGYTQDFPAERMMLNAEITQLYEGTNQIQRIVMARAGQGLSRAARPTGEAQPRRCPATVDQSVQEFRELPTSAALSSRQQPSAAVSSRQQPSAAGCGGSSGPATTWCA